MDDQIDVARRIAYIMGPSSAAAQAVSRYDTIVSAGFPTKMILSGRSWLVQEPKPFILGESADA